MHYSTALLVAIVSCSSVFVTTNQLLAVEHGVVVVAASPARLQEIENQLPAQVRTEMQDMASNLAGSLLSIAAPNQPIGLWLDWKGELPLPVFFMANPKIDELQASLQRMSIEAKDTGEEIFELSTPSPMYYRELGAWYFFSANREDLLHVSDPLKLVNKPEDNIVTFRAALTKIPLASRKEISNVLAARLLPFTVASRDAVTPENMVHTYGKRLLDSITEKSKTLEIGVNVIEDRLVLDVNVEALHPSGHKKVANPMLPELTTSSNGLRFHTSLSDEEVALLSWWAQSIPDRVKAAFEQAQVEDRTGEKSLEQLAKLGSELLFKLSQSGELEGYVAAIEEEVNVPLVALNVNESDWLDAQFREFINSGIAADMLVKGAELDMETIAGIKLHRLTLSEDAEAPISVVVGLGRNTLFITLGEQGLENLREHLNTIGDASASPTPLALRVPEISLGTILGWQDTELQPSNGIYITSDYTESGTHYRLQFGE